MDLTANKWMIWLLRRVLEEIDATDKPDGWGALTDEKCAPNSWEEEQNRQIRIACHALIKVRDAFPPMDGTEDGVEKGVIDTWNVERLESKLAFLNPPSDEKDQT